MLAALPGWRAKRKSNPADEQTGATDPTEENEGVWEMIECDKRLLLFPDPATQKWVVDEPLQSPEGDEVYSLLCGK